jgi:hypothetical protein
MSVQDIQDTLKGLYGVDVSPTTREAVIYFHKIGAMVLTKFCNIRMAKARKKMKAAEVSGYPSKSRANLRK